MSDRPAVEVAGVAAGDVQREVLPALIDGRSGCRGRPFGLTMHDAKDPTSMTAT